MITHDLSSDTLVSDLHRHRAWLGRFEQGGEQFMKTPWLPAHADEMVRLRALGYSASLIASAINKQFHTSYSRNAVISKACRLDLPMLPRKLPAVSLRKNGGSSAPRRAAPISQPIPTLPP